jgi:hypothetical protein
MAETQTLILDIQFKSEDVIKKTADLKNQVAGLKTANAELLKSEGQVTDAYIKTATEIKFLTKEISNNERQLLVQAQAVNANAGSYEQLLRNFQLAEVELKNLTGTLQQNADGTTEFTEAYFNAKKQVDQAKQGILLFNSGISVGTQNVGNYGNTLEGMRAKLSDLQKVIQSTDVNSVQFSEAKTEAENLGLAIGQLEGKLDEFGNKEPKNPAKRTFEDTIATAGAAASASQLVSLAFGENKEVTEAMAASVKSLAIGQQIANIVKEKGAIADTFAAIAQKSLIAGNAILAFGTTVLTGITTAFGVASAAAWTIATLGVAALIGGIAALIVYFDDIKNAVTDFLGLTSEQTRAATLAAEQYKKQGDAINFARDAYDRYSTIVGATYDREIKLASAAGKNTVELEKQKAKSFEDSTNKLILQLQAQLKLGQAAKISAKEQIALSREIQDLQGKVLDSKTETAAKDIAIETEKNEKIAAANKAAGEKAAADRKKYNETLVSLDAEFNLSEREKLAKTFTDKSAALKGNGEKEIQLREKIEADKQAALLKFDENLAKAEADKTQTRIDNELSIQAQLLATEQDSLTNRLALFENSFAAREAALIKQGATEVQIEKIKQAEIQKIKDTFAAEDFNNQIAALNAQLKLDQDAVDLSTATEAEKQAAKLDIQIKSLEQQLALTAQFAGADGLITQTELQGIQTIQTALEAARKGLGEVKTDQPTFGESLGLSDEDVEKAAEAAEAIGSGLNKVQEIVNLGFETQLNNIDKGAQAEIDAVNNSTLNEEQKAARIKEINKKSAQEKYKIAKKQFETDKAFATAQALIGAAQAIIQGFAQLGPIGGAIAAITTAALTAAQISAIQSQPPPAAPGFAKGVIGLNGPGTETSDSIPARLSRGESVITARGTNFAQTNYPGLLEFLNTRNRFATGVINFGGANVPTAANDSTERLISAISGISPIVKVTDINKKQSDYSEVRVNGTI